MSKENKVIVVSYDQNLNRLGVIDVFRSLIWTRKYYECGTFELHAPLNTRNLQLLAENNILSKREFKDKNGHIVKTTSKESGIVEYIAIDDTVNEITAKGRFLPSIMDRRAIKTVVMNSTNTNTGGFPASALKTTLNTTIFNTLPADLRAVIKADKRLCSKKGSWVWQEDQKLWLPSEVEVWGYNTWSEVEYGNGCGVQFPIFTGSLRHICKGQGKGKAEQGSRSGWWCGSPDASDTTNFCYVASNGYASGNYASTAFAVPLCFTV